MSRCSFFKRLGEFKLRELKECINCQTNVFEIIIIEKEIIIGFNYVAKPVTCILSFLVCL